MRILILTSATGGGHDMRARALEAWIRTTKPSWTTKIHHALEDSHGVYKFGVELYNFIQRTWPPLHHIYYNFLELAGVMSSGKAMLGQARYIELLEEYKPDLIFSVHDSTNHCFFEVARKVLGTKVRCVIYCSEMHGGYGMSRHWVNPDADLFIASLPETIEGAIRLRMPEQRIRLGGFLLHPDFYNPPTAAERSSFWQEQLLLDPSINTVILGTGANGANHHLPLLKAIQNFKAPLQLVVLCGKSQKKKESILQYAQRNQSSDLSIRPLTTTNKMSLLMHGAMAIVGRPGAGLSNEAIQAGCPLIINKLNGLMPQEMINERFAIKHKISSRLRTPKDLCTILNHWLNHIEDYQQLKQRITHIRPKQHPSEILAMLESL
ncbi:glycosyltransferase [Legionella sp. WA2022007384]